MKKGQSKRFSFPTEEKKLDKALLEQAERKRAKRSISHLQKQFPNKSLIQLIPVILKYGGPFAAKIAIERIKRNQKDSLTADERIFIMEVQERLEESKECPLSS